MNKQDRHRMTKSSALLTTKSAFLLYVLADFQEGQNAMSMVDLCDITKMVAGEVAYHMRLLTRLGFVETIMSEEQPTRLRRYKFKQTL